MSKNTLQLEERDCLTLAGLVSKALEEAKDADNFTRRSLVRLAVRVHELAGKDSWPRVQVLNHAPTWVFAYLAKPLFPEGNVLEAPAKPRKRAKARTEPEA